MFTRRFMAFLIDIMPITIMTWLFFWHFRGLDIIYYEFMNNVRDIEAREAFISIRDQIKIIASVLCLIYFVIFECSNTKNTIGKSIFRIRVESSSDPEISPSISFKRNMAKFFSILPGGLGLLYPLFNKERQFFHDKIANTKVVKVTKL